MDKERVKILADRLFGDLGGAMTAAMSYLGVQTGLFRAMAGAGPLTVEAVVVASGLRERYVREWLAGMASAGYLEYDASAATWSLPEEAAFLLASEGTDHYMGGLFAFVPPLVRMAPRVAEAFREGGGVPFAHFGVDCIEALDAINAGTYDRRLVDYWLQALPDVVERLREGGRALDVGCGAGRVPILLGRQFPAAQIVGLDTDIASIAIAQRQAESAGLGNRVRFVAGDIDALATDRAYDLVTALDCIHDFAEPVRTLSRIRALLEPDGTLFIVEPRVADAAADNRNPIATMYYGFSLLHCLTQSLSQGGAGLGTCMGPARTEAVVREAGFTRFESVDIRSQVQLFYAAQP